MALTAKVVDIPYIKRNHTKDVRDLAGKTVALYPEQLKLRGGKPDKIVVGKNKPNNEVFVSMPFRYLEVDHSTMMCLTQPTK